MAVTSDDQELDELVMDTYITRRALADKELIKQKNIRNLKHKLLFIRRKVEMRHRETTPELCWELMFAFAKMKGSFQDD